MAQIQVTIPSYLNKKVETFPAKKYEIYMSTHGVLVIRCKYERDIVKTYAEGQWETAEVVD